ncbi:SMI1/KNR4 family protein [Nocardia veterana]|uniref:Knr4/Smi1-like domain-containing protein n=1 Tax=Nocardia veterana TaxID=132249 RepID=A0A7X6RJR6_9NOCA|nr:SMI1/KNR4 family protein [Nocardia veterana]NKY88490.1 hypothetical protein [Nocardia veterana]
MPRRSAVTQLADLLPPSPLPVSPLPYWREIEETLGHGLPADYKEFIDRYGAGSINGELSVFYPIDRYSDDLVVERRDAWFDDYSFGHSEDLPAGRLIEWGGNEDGDRCFWFVDDEYPDSDPDTWPVYVYFRDRDLDDCWHRFDGGMAEFLTGVVDGEFEGADDLVGGIGLPLRWHLHGDHDSDYGDAPRLSLSDGSIDDHPPGWQPQSNGQGWQRLHHGSLLWLLSFDESGGDQEYFFRTGKLRRLITLDGDHHTIRLEGGILSPGTVYTLSGSVDIAVDGTPSRIGIEALVDGPAVTESAAPSDRPTDIFEQWDRTWVRLPIATEISVPAKKSAALRIRVVAEPATDVLVQTVQLEIHGVAGR